MKRLSQSEGAKLALGDTVTICSGFTQKPLSRGHVGRVVGRCAKWVTVETDAFKTPVRFRTSGQLCGVRIIGGLAEQLNEYVSIES
jgi:hypothetical protein